MPTYEYECFKPSCGHKFSSFMTLKEYEDKGGDVTCPKCGAGAVRIISAPSLNCNHLNAGSDASYFDYGLGEVVTSQRKKKDALARAGLRVVESDYTASQKRHVDEVAHRQFLKDKWKRRTIPVGTANPTKREVAAMMSERT